MSPPNDRPEFAGRKSPPDVKEIIRLLRLVRPDDLPMSGVLNRKRAELLASEGRDFESKLLPVARILYPALSGVSALRGRDRAGQDLVALKDDGTLEVVFQCKSSPVARFADTGSIDEALKSIEAFRKSGQKTEWFILVIAHRGIPRAYREGVVPALDSLVAEGLAKHAQIKCVNALLEDVVRRVQHEIRDASKMVAMRLRLERARALGQIDLVVDHVPARSMKLRVQKEARVEILEDEKVDDFDLAEITRWDSKARWLLITGVFGAGKSTAVLNACLNGNIDFVFVPCRELPTSTVELVSTKMLLSSVCRVLDYDGRFEDPFKHDLSGEVLEAMLASDKNRLLLVFDALDEHRHYASRKGFTELSNHVKRFRCPVVFTVRQEIVDGLLGHYEAPLKNVSDAGGSPRPGRKLELLPWTDEHIVRRIAGHAERSKTQVERDRLLEFVTLVQTGEIQDAYGDLVRNPLMLSFLLDDVATCGVRKLTRPELLFDYIERKIIRDRDRAPQRSYPGRETATSLLVARMLRAMMAMAWDMAEKGGPVIVPGESISVRSALSIAGESFGEPVTIEALALNSLLVTRRAGTYSEAKVAFVIQLFGEFMLALQAYCVQAGVQLDDASERLSQEISAAIVSNPSSPLAEFAAETSRVSGPHGHL